MHRERRVMSIPRCKTCKHFRLATVCKDWLPEYDVNAFGECATKLGIGVEISIDTGTYGSGGVVDEITVDALFGCVAHEPRDES